MSLLARFSSGGLNLCCTVWGTLHMYLYKFKLKLNELELNLEFSTSAMIATFKYSAITHGWWLPYWAAQIQNIFTIIESSTGQYQSRYHHLFLNISPKVLQFRSKPCLDIRFHKNKAHLSLYLQSLAFLFKILLNFQCYMLCKSQRLMRHYLYL
jgi:hypothetical protein